MAEANQEQ